MKKSTAHHTVILHVAHLSLHTGHSQKLAELGLKMVVAKLTLIYTSVLLASGREKYQWKYPETSARTNMLFAGWIFPTSRFLPPIYNIIDWSEVKCAVSDIPQDIIRYK